MTTRENGGIIKVQRNKKGNKLMTPVKMRNLIDTLVQQYGIDNVKITIESILKFYEKTTWQQEEMVV